MLFFLVGLDLGQASDYSALAILEEQLWAAPETDWPAERVFFPEGVEPNGWISPSAVAPLYAERILAANLAYGRPGDPPLHVRHLERFELGTRYTEIVESVKGLLLSDPIRRRLHRTRLLVDATGVGRAVVDGFYDHGVNPIAVTIHGGSAVTQEPRGYRVPKRDLVSAAQVLLQNGRLRVAEDLQLAPVLKRELLNFRVRIDPKTAHDSYTHWREGDHDDMVLSVALASWYRQYAVRPAEAEYAGVLESKPSEFSREPPRSVGRR